MSAEVRERIAAAAEGNPLFVEQISAMAAEDSGQLTIPPSIQALLAERLDRLSADERDVIERAAVVGRDFPVAAVAGLLPGDQRTLLTPQLLALARKGLVRPDPAPSGGDDRFSFQHVLVRDAAYNAMPKELRAALHQRLADLMDDSGPGRELDELLGYHVEQAYRYRHEVGFLDEHTKQLRLRASELLEAGGTRALGRQRRARGAEAPSASGRASGRKMIPRSGCGWISARHCSLPASSPPLLTWRPRHERAQLPPGNEVARLRARLSARAIVAQYQVRARDSGGQRRLARRRR